MIAKAVIPVAGLGIRFLPITKAQPKEMLPVVNKPVIQYVIEEAYQANIHTILLITGRHKRAVEDHLDKTDLKHNSQLLQEFERILEKINIHYIRQKSPEGLGDAIKYAENFIDEDDFALLLGDNITIPNCTEHLITVYKRYQSPLIAIERISKDKIKNHGVILGEEVEKNIFKINELFEKPEKPVSDLGIIGRYILSPEIFDYLHKTKKGYGGELQLTDALKDMVLDGKHIYAALYGGKRYDLGNNMDWLKANIEIALEDKNIGKNLRNWLISIIG